MLGQKKRRVETTDVPFSNMRPPELHRAFTRTGLEPVCFALCCRQRASGHAPTPFGHLLKLGVANQTAVGVVSVASVARLQAAEPLTLFPRVYNSVLLSILVWPPIVETTLP